MRRSCVMGPGGVHVGSGDMQSPHRFDLLAVSAIASVLCSAPSFAQRLAITDPAQQPAAIFREVMPDQREPDDASVVPAHLRRQIVNYRTSEASGTIVIDTRNTYLYYVLGGGKAVRYGIGVGRDGFTWSGT